MPCAYIKKTPSKIVEIKLLSKYPSYPQRIKKNPKIHMGTWTVRTIWSKKDKVGDTLTDLVT